MQRECRGAHELHGADAALGQHVHELALVLERGVRAPQAQAPHVAQVVGVGRAGRGDVHHARHGQPPLQLHDRLRGARARSPGPRAAASPFNTFSFDEKGVQMRGGWHPLVRLVLGTCLGDNTLEVTMDALQHTAQPLEATAGYGQQDCPNA